MNKWVAGVGSLLFVSLAGCATPPGAPEAREVVSMKALESTAPVEIAQAAPPRDVYHEKFVSFVFAGVDNIEVQPKVYRTGSPVEFRVSGSLPYVNDQIESVETEVDPQSHTVKVSVVVRRPAIRLPMIGQYDVKATFVPPAAGQYVLKGNGVRTVVVVNG